MKINAGLTFKHTFSLPDYSADEGWTLTGYITNATASYALASGVFDGDGSSWELTIPAATTTGYTAGVYQIHLRAADGTDTLLAYEGTVNVTADAASATETRTANRIILDQLDTVITTKSTQDHDSLTIDGRSIARMKWEEILKVRAVYARKVQAEERAAAGQSPVRVHKLGFSNA